MVTDTQKLFEKMFLASIILFSTISGRDFFDRTKEKTKKLFDANKNIFEVALIYSILYLFSKDYQTSVIGSLFFIFVEHT